MEFTELLGGNIAVHAKTDASCPVPNGKNDDDYDYNGDGKYDASDMVNRNNFVQHNFVFHDNYFHATKRTDGTYTLDMAYYLGNSNMEANPYTRDCINSDGSTSTVAVVNPVIEGVQIYNNIIDTMGDKTVQVGSATKDCKIYNNYINKAAQLGTTDIMAINLNPGSYCDVYGNLLTNIRGTGILNQGDGGRIYNNVIVNVGLSGTYYTDGIWAGQKAGNYNKGNSLLIVGNTIINPVGHGITSGVTLGTDNRVQNNIIVNPGMEYFDISGTFKYNDHNLLTMNINDVKFTNPSANDYTLQAASPAINAGVDSSSLGISTDYTGLARSLPYDIGAYEYR
jgi:hypothetical protein